MSRYIPGRDDAAEAGPAQVAQEEAAQEAAGPPAESQEVCADDDEVQNAAQADRSPVRGQQISFGNQPFQIYFDWSPERIELSEEQCKFFRKYMNERTLRAVFYSPLTGDYIRIRLRNPKQNKQDQLPRGFYPDNEAALGLLRKIPTTIVNFFTTSIPYTFWVEAPQTHPGNDGGKCVQAPQTHRGNNGGGPVPNRIITGLVKTEPILVGVEKVPCVIDFSKSTTKIVLSQDEWKALRKETSKSSWFGLYYPTVGEIKVRLNAGTQSKTLPVIHAESKTNQKLIQHLPKVPMVLFKTTVPTTLFLEEQNGAVSNPKKAFAAIIGGCNVSSKIGVIESLLEKCEILLLGGRMAFTFLKAQGFSVGSSLVDEDEIEFATSLMETAKAKGVSVLLPTDVVVADKFAADAESKTVPTTEIPEGWFGLDIGPDSIKTFNDALNTIKTVVWNGPVGVFEFEKFAVGTEAIAKKLAELCGQGVTTIIGGDDLVAAVEKVGVTDKMSHVFRGVDAMLELLEDKVAIAALVELLEDKVLDEATTS